MPDYKNQYLFQSHYLSLDGVRMHYLDEGSRQAPPIVMVHGNPTWSFYWRKLIPELSRQYRVIVPDHIGCGFSDKPQEYPYTLEQHIRNLERLIAHLGLQRVSLIMHDWGGAIASGYAVRHSGNIERLVVFNTSAFFEPVLYFPIKLSRLPLLGDLLVRGLNAFALGALWMGTAQHQRFTADVRAGYLAPYRTWHDRVAILRFVRDIPMKANHPTRGTIDAIENGLPLLAEKPMCIIWGADDPVFTVDTFLAGWRVRFPQAQVNILEKAGHYVVEDAPERILPLLRVFFNLNPSAETS
ncbi:MAG: alpha/beta fold hydrolase [Anaerolineae bacterium]|nr:alpha/beta fold hydrolase [Anaerolineae bacterium]